MEETLQNTDHTNSDFTTKYFQKHCMKLLTLNNKYKFYKSPYFDQKQMTQMDNV